MKRLRRVAWLVMVIADAGLLAWGMMAALAPEHLLGPGSAPILTAGYEGFTKSSWSELAGHVSDDRRVHDGALPGVRRIHRGVRAAGGRRRCHGLPPW